MGHGRQFALGSWVVSGNLNDAVILTEKCSITGWIQRFGRGQRAYPSKVDCEGHDLRGAFYLHGSPDDDRAWSLDGAQGKPLADRANATRRCGACGLMSPPVTRCPHCGSTTMVDPRPMRVQRAEMYEASTIPVAVRAQRYVEGTERAMTQRGMRPEKAAILARAKAPSWVKEALRGS